MGGMLKGMGAKASTMTMIDMHAHFLSDFYRDALLVAGLRQADGITPLPAWDVGAALQAMDRLSMRLGRPSCIRAVSQGVRSAGAYRRDCHVPRSRGQPSLLVQRTAHLGTGTATTSFRASCNSIWPSVEDGRPRILYGNHPSSATTLLKVGYSLK